MSPNTRFESGPVRLDTLARQFDLELRGDPGVEIDAVATLEAAGEHDLAFLANPAYRKRLAQSRAGAVIVAERDAAAVPGAALVAADPYAAWAALLNDRFPPRAPRPGVDPSAQLAESACVDAGAEIGALCRIADEAVVESGAVLGPGCIVERGARIGAGARLAGRVYVGEGCMLGRRVLVHAGAVIGADGFGLAMRDGCWQRLPQLGCVRIGDDSDIGANTTIDRGALGDTVLGVDVRVDNQVQIGHNVEIGDHTAIAGCVGIAGSTRVGRYCLIAGASGIAGHLEICDSVTITAMSTVLDSIDRPGAYGSAIPARPLRSWQRTLVRLTQLDRLFAGRARRD